MMILPYLVAASFASLAYLPFQNRETARAWTALLKPLCALILAIAFVTEGKGAIATIFGFAALGDVLLTRKGEGAFMAGLIAFLIAHVLLVPAFFDVFEASEGRSGEINPIALLALLLAFGAGVYAALWQGLTWPLRVAVPAYILAILLMVWSANLATGVLFVGALVFAASDAVLAIERFRVQRVWMGPFVWASYAAALVLIAYGLANAAL